MSKFTHIPSEIRSVLSKKCYSSVIEAVVSLFESFRFNDKSFGGVKRENCQLRNSQLFQLLVLLPFFAVKGFSHYGASALSRMFGGEKSLLYSFAQQDNIDWRGIVYRIAGKLISKTIYREDSRKSYLPKVLSLTIRIFVKVAKGLRILALSSHMLAINLYSDLKLLCFVGAMAYRNICLMLHCTGSKEVYLVRSRV